MTTSTPHCSSSNGNTSNAVNTTSSSSSGSSLKADNNHRATTLYNGNSPGATSTTTATAAAAAAANIGSTNRVMQADEDFNIRFVNLVRTHRCLYDKKVPEYRNRDNQEKAWALISEDTRESVIHCKERWRNLRACLSRYIKQQSGSEPQHKPYYLTEHMAFLLPFLKSTRNSLDGNNSLASLYKFSQQHLHFQQQQQHQQHQQEHLYCNNNNNTIDLKNESAMELKQSLSENDDEETIDAFDPAIAAQLALQHTATAPGSPVHSDTASANSLQNFIPDVQLAESGQDLIYNDSCSTPHFHNHSLHNHIQQQQQQQHQQQQQQQQQQSPCSAKRIKTECEATSSGYFGNLSVTEHTDMEFFRSILPDIAALTPQQRRKFKIGILELIDDVVERYPNHGVLNGSAGSSSTASTGGNRQQQRRSSGRDWRK